MKFFVTERINRGGHQTPEEFRELAKAELEYKADLEKKGKIVGGPFLDALGGGYILETGTIEELGEIFFNSPANFVTEREVHPLGTFGDSLKGMEELGRK